MSKDIEVKEKSNDGLSAKVRHLEEEVTYLKSKMQRISDNWKAYAKKFLGSAAIDGKLGFAKLGWLVMVAFLSLVVTAAMAETSTWYPFDTNVYGVVSIIGNSSTKKVAITADSVSCLTTSVSVSVFTASGTITSLNSQVNNALTVNSNVLVKGTTSTFTNNVVVSNTLTVGTAISLPAGSVEATDIASGTMANAMIISNATTKLYVQTIVIPTGGTLSGPQGIIASSNLVGRTELASSISCSIATNANGGTNVCTFTVKDLAGTAMADQCAFRFFISDAVSGAPAAVAGDVVISGGVELQEVVNKADYWVFSTLSNGTAIATITDTPGSTNFIHAVAPCGKISRVTSAFNVP